jgi:hypothetical protein
MGRIIPTLGNPKGYPPYELVKVLGYTNCQILYYICRGQITDSAAFQKAKKSHDELLQSLGDNSNSNDESTTLPHEPTTQLHQRERVTTPHSDARLTAFSIPEAMDSEPNEILPALIPGGKGLKIDKIAILKRGSGLLNYQTWVQEAHNAFLANPY